MKRITYKKSGVNIEKADEFIQRLKNIFGHNKLNKVSAFGSLFALKPLLGKYKDPVLVSSTDGVGTKLLIAQEANKHNTVGIDLVAMNVNDLVCLGAKPLFFLDYIACGKVKVKVLEELMRGLNKGLKEADCLLLGGETAEMPGMYKPDEYDLAGFSVGIVDQKKIINGRNIKKGDLIIGLESNGLHSNGFSLVRKALGRKGIKKYKRELLKPTRIYIKTILALLDSLEGSKNLSAVKAIAHVTGGAFYSKITKVLPEGSGMLIAKGNWRVPDIFNIIQEKGKILDKEMYSVFNMGIGMVLVVDKKKANSIIRNLAKNCRAYVIGEVISSKDKMVLI